LFCVVFALAAFAQKEDWLPVTQQDLSINAVPDNPGAPAIQLYYEHLINDQDPADGYAFFYKRIKILNDKGIRYADVEIPFLPQESISGIKARTIHPDGKITDYTGKPFEKTLIKSRGFKINAKTFTLPDVTVGSIVEWRYRVGHGTSLVSDEWVVQHELFTVKEYFRLKAYQGRMITEDGDEPAQVSLNYTRLPPNVKPRLKGDTFEMDAQNIPAFEAEENMPPEDSYKPHVRFFYGSRDILSPDKFWQNLGRKINDEVERFIGNSQEVRQAAAQAVGEETDPEKKLRKLYARAQEIRNLTYERSRTEEEKKKENLKKNNNAADVVKHGYGDREDITRLFIALVRASGMPASIAEVSNREDRLFEKGVLSRSELDSELAIVSNNGKEIYLDPGTQFCPYGLIRWFRTSTAALRPDKNGGTFVNVPASNYDQAIIARTANMTFNADGSLKGEITVQFKGLHALELRLEALRTDEAGRKKNLEDEMSRWLTAGAVVKLTDSKAWDKKDEPVVAVFDVEIPGFATVAGKRILMPATLFQAANVQGFRHAERKFPVYFPFNYAEEDSITIKFPSGYSSESVPQNQAVSLPYARYQSVSQFSAGQLVTQRQLLMNGMYFEVPRYPEIKGFFNSVQSGDEQQVVLRGGVTNAEKSN
jgi:hypothetical protein